MDRRLVIRAERCVGCGLCELACAIARTRECAPGRARVRVWRDARAARSVPSACRHCVDPPCLVSCLMNVIERDPGTGLVRRRLEGCIGCRACMVACPFEAAFYDSGADVVVSCDLCGGDPQCVRYCPSGALAYEEPDAPAWETRLARARQEAGTEPRQERGRAV